MILGHLIAHAFGRTQAGQFLNLVSLVLFVLALPVASVVGFSAFTWQEVAKECSYSRRFGEGWKMQYEAEQGPLSAARTKVVLAVVAAVVNVCLGVWLYRQLIPALLGSGHAMPSSRRHRRRHRSSP
jgi:hypothetical protein